MSPLLIVSRIALLLCWCDYRTSYHPESICLTDPSPQQKKTCRLSPLPQQQESWYALRRLLSHVSLSMLINAQVLYAFLYVAPFYLSPTTRPSPQLSRDAPSVIRGRISAVTLSCILCSVCTFVFLASIKHGSRLHAMHSMGYFPPGFLEAAKCLILTCILFLGPLFEDAIVEGAWKDWLRLRGAGALFYSWIGYRNIIAVC